MHECQSTSLLSADKRKQSLNGDYRPPHVSTGLIFTRDKWQLMNMLFQTHSLSVSPSLSILFLFLPSTFLSLGVHMSSLHGPGDECIFPLLIPLPTTMKNLLIDFDWGFFLLKQNRLLTFQMIKLGWLFSHD